MKYDIMMDGMKLETKEMAFIKSVQELYFECQKIAHSYGLKTKDITIEASREGK